MFGIQQLANRETSDTFFTRWPAIAPRHHAIGQLIANAEFAGHLVHNDDVHPAIAVKIARAEEFLRRFIDERGGDLRPATGYTASNRDGHERGPDKETRFHYELESSHSLETTAG